LVAAVCLAILATGCDRVRSPASVACATVKGAGRGPTRRILIVGESWATGGRLLPELPTAAARRTSGDVRACQIGYSGRNTSLQLTGFEQDFSDDQVLRLTGGAPDAIVIVTGVNDVVQHVGAARYRRDVLALADAWLV
jgi:hypothetical protein